ncbi:hypothetical protein COBT_003069, partial [Conglomerata obtusa]
PKYIEQIKNLNFNVPEFNTDFHECSFITRPECISEHSTNDQCNLSDSECYITHGKVIKQSILPNYRTKRTRKSIDMSSNVDSNEIHCSSNSRKIKKLKSYLSITKDCVTDSQMIDKMSLFENEYKYTVLKQKKPIKQCQMKKQEFNDKLFNNENFDTTFNYFHNHLSEIITEVSTSKVVQNINSTLPVKNTIKNCHENCNFCINKPNFGQAIDTDYDPYGIDETDITNIKFFRYCLEGPNKVFKNYKTLRLIKNNIRTLQNNDCLLLHHLKIYEKINKDIKKFTIKEWTKKLPAYNRFYVEQFELYLQNYKVINITQTYNQSKTKILDSNYKDIISLTQFLDLENCFILTEICKRDNDFFYRLHQFVENNFFTDEFEFDILYTIILLNVHKIDEMVSEKLNYIAIKLFIIKILKESLDNTLLHFIELSGLIYYLENSNDTIIYNKLFKDFGVYLSLLNVLAVLLKYDWNQIKTITDNVVGNSDKLIAYSKLIAKFEKYRQIFNIVLLYVVRPFLTPLLYLQAWQKNVLRNIFSKYYLFYKMKILQTFRIKMFFFQLIDLVLYPHKTIFEHKNTGQVDVGDNEELLYFIICNCNNTKLKKFLVNLKKRTELITIFENVLQTLNVIVAEKVDYKHSVFIGTFKIILEHLSIIHGNNFKYKAYEVVFDNINENENNENYNLKC